MVAMNFPDSPVQGQLFTSGSTTWQFDGTNDGAKWVIIPGDSGGYIQSDGSVMMTAPLVVHPTPSASNLALDLPEDYAIYADNTGPGTDNSRLWVQAPNGGAVYVGPRAGGEVLNLINLRATNVHVDGVQVIDRGGSAGNQEWVKFYDGTMIQWLRHETTAQTIDATYGSLFIGSRGPYSFSPAFVGIPSVTIGEARWGTGASWGQAYAASASSFMLRLFDTSSRPTGTTVTISWQAVGRWK